MICPECKHNATKVKEKRCKKYTARRRRMCKRCGHIFWTWEVYIPDGTKEETRKQLITGLKNQK